MKTLKMIGRSIVALKKQVRAAVKELNQEAAKRLAKGRYDDSTALIDTAKRASAFVAEVEALRSRWKSIRGVGDKRKGEKTPLWRYYELIAKGLDALGGAASRGGLIEWIEQHGAPQLKNGDKEVTQRGRVVWQRNLGRAKRAMLREGFLEKGAGWRLTDLGRNLVSSRFERGGSTH